jgi:hypothetical protein
MACIKGDLSAEASGPGCRSHEPQKQTMKAKHTLVAAGAAATIRSGLLDATCE